MNEKDIILMAIGELDKQQEKTNRRIRRMRFSTNFKFLVLGSVVLAMYSVVMDEIKALKEKTNE